MKLEKLGWKLTNRIEVPLKDIKVVDGKWDHIPTGEKKIYEVYEHKWVLDDYEYLDEITIMSNGLLEWEKNYEESIEVTETTLRAILERMDEIHDEGKSVRTETEKN